MQGVRKHTDYATRVLMHLASLGNGAHTQVKDITDRRLLPAPFVRRVVARLAAAGLLRTTRGHGGGVRLARPAARISLLDVVRAMEGEIVLNRCVSEKGDCPLGEKCPVHRVWTEATRSVENHLSSVTIASLADAQETPVLSGGTRPAHSRNAAHRSHTRRSRKET